MGQEGPRLPVNHGLAQTWSKKRKTSVKSCPACEYPNPENRDTCFKCQTALDAGPAVAQPAAQEPEPDAQAEAPVDLTVCANCGLAAEEGDYSIGLCSSCRDKMARMPLPAWVVGSLVVVGLVLMYAFALFPGSLGAGIAFARGRRAEAQGNYAQAAAEYKVVSERFPDSTLALARLGIAQCRSGNLPEAARTFMKLEGKKAPSELVREVEQVIGETERSLRRQPGAGRRP